MLATDCSWPQINLLVDLKALSVRTASLARDENNYGRVNTLFAAVHYLVWQRLVVVVVVVVA